MLFNFKSLKICGTRTSLRIRVRPKYPHDFEMMFILRWISNYQAITRRTMHQVSKINIKAQRSQETSLKGTEYKRKNIVRIIYANSKFSIFITLSNIMKHLHKRIS